MLKHFYLTQLILAGDVDDSDLGVKLALLLVRYDATTKMTDVTSDAVALDVLMKVNIRETW